MAAPQTYYNTNDSALARALAASQYDSPTEVNSSSSKNSDGSIEMEFNDRRPPSTPKQLGDEDDIEHQDGMEEGEAGNQPNKSRRCKIGSVCFLLVLAAVFVIVMYFVVILDGDVNNIQVPEAWNSIFDEDPFDSVDPENASRWRNGGQGVNLKVINALDARWQPYFEKSMTEWDNGYPDALDLTLARETQPEPECVPEQGYVKACNGNYGETSWKGRAEMLVDPLSKTIIAASARLNEFYLSERNRDEMQYAMCHELGHAWGVHHTDESFTNRNLGNCMDYTNKHRTNLSPDQSNYIFLHALYGLVPGAAPYSAPTAAPTPAPTPVRAQSGSFTSPTLPSNNGSGNNNPSNRNNDNNEEEEENDKKNKDLRSLDTVDSAVLEEEPSHFSQELVEAIRESRRHEDPNGGSFEVDLPGGYVLHVHLMLA